MSPYPAIRTGTNEGRTDTIISYDVPSEFQEAVKRRDLKQKRLESSSKNKENETWRRVCNLVMRSLASAGASERSEWADPSSVTRVLVYHCEVLFWTRIMADVDNAEAESHK